jgi:hypothetical protein
MRVKDLTEAEKLALGDLLYLVTHDEELNKTVLGNYVAARAGNPEMLAARDFAAALDSLYAKSCK